MCLLLLEFTVVGVDVVDVAVVVVADVAVVVPVVCCSPSGG